MTKDEIRAAIVCEAQSWIGTPYISNGMIKGRRGGTDCAMLLVAVYQTVGLVPKDFDPRPYPPQWHIHRNEEKYMNFVLRFAKEVAPPPEREPLAGDIVLFKIGHAFAHGAIITKWPNVIHALGMSIVTPADISRATTGKRALWFVEKHFFSPFGE